MFHRETYTVPRTDIDALIDTIREWGGVDPTIPRADRETVTLSVRWPDDMTTYCTDCWTEGWNTPATTQDQYGMNQCAHHAALISGSPIDPNNTNES